MRCVTYHARDLLTCSLFRGVERATNEKRWQELPGSGINSWGGRGGHLSSRLRIVCVFAPQVDGAFGAPECLGGVPLSSAVQRNRLNRFLPRLREVGLVCSEPNGAFST